MAVPRQRRERGWFWHCTVETAEAGKVSVLAVVETVLATGIYAGFGLMYGTTHLVVSACIAPFLLLRTPISIERGLELTNTLGQRALTILWRIESKSEKTAKFTLCIFIMLVVPIVLVVIKIVATVSCVIRDPASSLKAIPNNWWKQAAAMDIFYPVELLPGVEASQQPLPGALASPQRDVLKFASTKLGAEKVTAFGAASLMLSLGLLTALTYRWSLKGTALLYSPFIWIVHSSMGLRVAEFVEDITRLAWYRLMLTYSCIALALFGAKLAVFNVALKGEQAIPQLLAKLSALSWWSIVKPMLERLWTFAEPFIQPHALPPWQLAAATNSVLGIALFFVAERLLTAHRRGHDVEHFGTALRLTALVRGTLSLYTIACTLYIAASMSKHFTLPPLGTKWFPWS